MSLRTTALCALVAASLTPVGAAVAAPAPVAAPTSTSSTGSAASSAGAPAFLVAAPARAGAGLAAPAGVLSTGNHLVTLRTSLLPDAASGQRIGFDVGRAAPVAGRISGMERGTAPGAHYTAWTGQLDGALGAFTIVRVGSTYRASVYSTSGTYVLTRAAGDLYWLSDAAPDPRTDGGEADALPPPAWAASPSPADRAAVAAPSAAREPAARKKRGKTKIDIVYAYTKSAKAAAGGTKAGIKAAVAQAVADTNLAYANSKIKLKVRAKAIVKTKGRETGNIQKDLNFVTKPGDGNFDSAYRARVRKHADLVHLFTEKPGFTSGICGLAWEPYTPATLNPKLGFSTSYIACLPYLIASHEVSHNLGADHDKYPGVAHISKVPYAYGFVDPAYRFATVMAYTNSCIDAGTYCPPVPFFSNPKTLNNGAAVGDKKHDNAKIIKKTAARVARYSATTYGRRR